MATPLSRSNSNAALSTGPSRTLLQQLLEEINGVASTRNPSNESPSQSSTSASSRSSPSNHVSSPWLRGSSLAQDAHDKLRAADEAHWRRPITNTIDGALDSKTPRLYLDTSRLDEQGTTLHDKHRSAVADDYLQRMHMLKDDLLPASGRLSPASQGQGHNLTHIQAPPIDNTILPPLSPLLFSDVYFDDSSTLSPQTETTVSPTEAPTSAATVYTTEERQTPTGNAAPKRTRFFDECPVESISQKRRAMTVPDLRDDGYFGIAVDIPHGFIGVGGDNRCLVRHEVFTERAPTPRFSVNTSMSDVLPELSSFRPTAADPQGQPFPTFPSPKLSRAFTSPVGPASPAVPDTPAWMRPMHLVDAGGKSIYTNVHDDGPIRHALCLWCFRTQGSFCKVHKYGYESCGRKEVLDSHYWEDDKWPEDSSDESAASDC